MIRPPPKSTLFPYTTLFRSSGTRSRSRSTWRPPSASPPAPTPLHPTWPSRLLQLDQDLPVPSSADVDGGLDPAASDVAGLSGNDVGFEVLGERPLCVGLGRGGDPVPFDLDEHVVHVVPVGVGARAGRRLPLPHPSPLLPEQHA